MIVPEMRFRPSLSLRSSNFDNGEEAFPFIVDDETKYARRISNAEATVFRLWTSGTTPDESVLVEEGLSEELLATVVDGFRALGFLDEGVGRHEIRAALQARWRRENQEALGETLTYAAATMPMYGARIPRTGDPLSFDRIPILSRTDLRAAFPNGYARDPAVIAAGIQSGEFSTVDSSGTTGEERSRVLSDNRRAALSTANARFINRALWPEDDHRLATFTTLHCAGLVCARDMPQMEMRTELALTLLPPEDPTSPTTEEITRTIREIRAYGANVLRVHPAYLAYLTWAAIDRGLELPQVRVIITTYEYRSKIHARLLSDAWRCPVYAEYSASELRGLPMIECERGVYHVNDRFHRLEALRDGRPARAGEVGRLVATTLRSRLPLIRFDTGDLVIAADPAQGCPCGALHAVLGRIAGRARDALSTPEGRLLTTADVDDVVSTVEGIRFYQLARLGPQDYQLTVVIKSGQPRGPVEEAARAALGPLLGAGGAVTLAFAPAVFPERSGKFRLTRSNVTETPPRAEAPQRAVMDVFAPL